MQVQKALRAQRIYAPAGNNAIEFYIALRMKQSEPDPTVESGLAELQPYAVIGAEQALLRQDFIEADRLRSLIAAADPQAPSLDRIAASIAAGKAAAALRKADTAARLAEQERILAEMKETARQAALRQEPAAPVAPDVQPEARPPPATAVAPLPQSAVTTPATVAAAPPAAQPVQAPARSASELVAVRVPQPVYPPDALRAGIAGEVVVKFVVNADGRVGDVAIISAQPQGVFDKNVLAAVRRWKFKPISDPMTVSRSFKFDR